MTPEDFFTTGEPWGQRVLDSDLLERIRFGTEVDHSDVEIGVALLRLAHDELQDYGTGENQRTDENDLFLRKTRRLAEK